LEDTWETDECEGRTSLSLLLITLSINPFFLRKCRDYHGLSQQSTEFGSEPLLESSQAASLTRSKALFSFTEPHSKQIKTVPGKCFVVHKGISLEEPFQWFGLQAALLCHAPLADTHPRLMKWSMLVNWSPSVRCYAQMANALQRCTAVTILCMHVNFPYFRLVWIVIDWSNVQKLPRDSATTNFQHDTCVRTGVRHPSPTTYQNVSRHVPQLSGSTCSSERDTP
jgi:hypothetical protein